MSFLLDTDVVSEWVKPDPAPTVVDWLSAVDEDGVFLSVVSLAELRRGVDLLAAARWIVGQSDPEPARAHRTRAAATGRSTSGSRR